MKIVILFLIFLSSNLLTSVSCELTENYKKAQIEAYKAIKGSESPYSKCRSSIREAHYWKLVAKCKVEGKSENIGGGCQHVVGYQIGRKKFDVSHCEVLKPKHWKNEVVAHLESIVESRKINKCKSN
ncbi:MAG: hypothetical protein ACPGJI_05820 [Kangiellaceae bacterium]